MRDKLYVSTIFFFKHLLFFQHIINAAYSLSVLLIQVIGFLIRYFSTYYTLHRSDLTARAAPLDLRLTNLCYKD